MGLDLDPQIESLSAEVIGAAIEVHRHLGPGLMEAAYERALGIELHSRGIEHTCQHMAKVFYKGHEVCEGRLDVWVQQQIVLELKASEEIHPVHMAQLLSYLRMTRSPLGLLINFNVPMLRDGIRRVVLSEASSSSSSSRPSRLRG